MNTLTEERSTSAIDECAARRALRIAVRHLNAPLAVAVTEDKALSWLSTGVWSATEEPLARALLDETETSTLLDLVLSGAIGYSALADRADRLLQPTHATRIWLDERRNG